MYGFIKTSMIIGQKLETILMGKLNRIIQDVQLVSPPTVRQLLLVRQEMMGMGCEVDM